MSVEVDFLEENPLGVVVPVYTVPENAIARNKEYQFLSGPPARGRAGGGIRAAGTGDELAGEAG
jgi:hypothetical protein